MSRRLPLFLLIAAFSLPPLLAAAPSITQIRVDVIRRAEDPSAPGGQVVVRNHESGESRTVGITAGNPIILNGSAGQLVTIHYDGDDEWAEDLTVAYPSEGVADHFLEVWPLGWIKGSLSGSSFPKKLTARVESPPQPPGHPSIRAGNEFDCRLDAKGEFTCRVPATIIDLALTAEGFAPSYFWDSRVGPSDALDLGKIRLIPGASLTAWLDRDQREEIEGAVTGELLHFTAPGVSGVAQRLNIPVRKATFDGHGRLQLTGLPPGTYRLRVTAEGFSPGIVSPVEIAAGEETKLGDAIVLEPPLRITLSISPPRTPEGRPWQIRLRRENDFESGYDDAAPVESRTDPAGRAMFDGRPPGLYFVRVLDATGNPVHQETRRISAGDTHVSITLDLIEAAGSVTRDGEPVRAALLFGGRNVVPSVRMETDERGRFAGLLPESRKWAVEIITSDGVSTIVSVSPPLDDLTIELSERTLSGTVLDTEGQPVSGARVMLFAHERPVDHVSDDEGRFSFESVDPGEVFLSARKGRHSSSSVKTEIPEEGPVPEVTLQLETSRLLEGRLLSGGKPVAGASLWVLAPSSSGGSTTTDLDGLFSFELNQSAGTVTIIAFAAGKALQAFSVDPEKSPLMLDVTGIGGTLDLTFPADTKEFFLEANGARIPGALIVKWMFDQGVAPTGPTLHVPNLAAQPYRVCAVFDDSAGRCKSVMLTPGGVVPVDLRVDNSAEEVVSTAAR